MTQSRWKSPILKMAIVALIAFGLKEFLGLEVGDDTINNAVDLIFLIVFGVAAANNPERKNQF